jgi:cytoskeleton protein RodZ
MSENLVMPDTLLNQENAAENLSVSAGKMLKQARVDAGLHIAALAVSLRVPVKRIEALENGQMDLLPDMVFVRALTSSICQTLKIDALPILDKLPKAALPRLNHDDVAINTPIGAASSAKAPWIAEFFTSPLLLGVLFLCVAAAGIYFWPQTAAVTVSQVPVVPKVLPELGVSQAKEVIVANESASASSVNASANSDVNPAVNAVNTAANNAPIVAVSNATSSTLSTPAVVSAPTSADNIVTFKATGDTWVEVKSATGGTLFKKLLVAGEAAGASGALPLTVIVGRADATQVEVRGKPVDLMSIAKSNVARFEVN